VIQFNRSKAGHDTYRKMIADCDVHVEHPGGHDHARLAMNPPAR
jgi:hypothetical protein